MMDMFSLAGQTALVTGSSRGLGRIVAAGLAQAGAQVVIHGSTNQSAAEGVRVLASDGIEAIPLAFDVREEAAAKAAAARLFAQGIQPSILLNNAGINLRGSLPISILPIGRGYCRPILTAPSTSRAPSSARCFKRGAAKLSTFVR
jgi:NAD(P)-dependent dehydrogenase (short-subunit alcohol dehydrogenase family)